jgi:hypothetical protein
MFFQLIDYFVCYETKTELRHLSTEHKYYSKNCILGFEEKKSEVGMNTNQSTIDGEIVFDFINLTKKNLNLLKTFTFK